MGFAQVLLGPRLNKLIQVDLNLRIFISILCVIMVMGGLVQLHMTSFFPLFAIDLTLLVIIPLTVVLDRKKRYPHKVLVLLVALLFLHASTIMCMELKEATCQSNSQWLRIAAYLYFVFQIAVAIVCYQVHHAYNIKRMMHYDTLTGLPNKLNLVQEVTHKIGTNPGLALISLHGLDAYNTYNGSEAGDTAIVAMSEALSHFQSDKAYIARLNTNEFAFYCVDTSELELINTLNQVQVSFLNNMSNSSQTMRLQLLMPFAILNNAPAVESLLSSYHGLYKRASICMTRVKEENIFVPHPYKDAMKQKFERRQIILNQLEKALKMDEFFMVFQSKHRAITGSCMGYEALARWNNPILGSVSPAEFIEAMSHSPLFLEISKTLFSKSLEIFSRYEAGMDSKVTLAVNISPLFFLDPTFETYVTNEIKRNNLCPRRLVLEITEDIMISDFDAVISVASRLKEQGIRLSLDDFGSGYSSLRYLRTIPFDEIKIDRSFINEVCTNDKAYDVFVNMVELARTTGYQVVAEGVETKEQAQMVMQAGCKVIQGYYFARPMAFEDLLTTEREN